MPCYANTNRLLPVILGLLAVACQANPYPTKITRAELALQQSGDYVLSAQLHYNLSQQALEALQNGVPLLWTLHVNIKQHRDWFWEYLRCRNRLPI